MAETFGEVLKSVRDAHGLSLAALAAQTFYGKTELSYVERGLRQPSAKLADVCDKVLGTTPLLTVLYQLNEGDSVERRTLIKGIAAGINAGGLGMGVFAEQVRDGLLDAIDATHDWDAIVAAYTRRLVVDPTPAFGQSLLTQLTVARHQVVETGGKDVLRASAELGHLYGLWLGNRGDISSAHNWYRTSILLADRSTHMPTMVFTRGRSVSRGIYEGYTLRETIAGADEALALSNRSTPGALEAYSALTHVHALTGDLAKGRTAVIGMHNVATDLPNADAIGGPIQRVASVESYFECRAGSIDDANRVFAEAERILKSAPVWLVEARMYFARAQVAAGDVAAGIDYALTAIRTSGQDARIIGVAVSDILSVVPTDYRSEELYELKTYAAVGPVPWEMLV